MATHSLSEIQRLIQIAKDAKGSHLNNALTTTSDVLADQELLLAESLAAVECHAQIALVRYIRLNNLMGNR